MCQCNCFRSFLLQDVFLNLQVFASEGQNMTFTVNVFLSLAFYIVTPVPAVIELFASTVGRFLSQVSYLPLYIFLRRRRSFTSRKLYACLEKFLCFELSEISKYIKGLFPMSRMHLRRFRRGNMAAPPPFARLRIPPAMQAMVLASCLV